MSQLRSAYVSGIRLLRKVVRPLGVLDRLEAGKSLRSRWLRSLFAIYDLDDLVRLDIPWWTFGAIDAVDAFLKDRPQARVFEWGAGASTVWLSKRAAEVVSVEHDADWVKGVKTYTDAAGNVQILSVASAPNGEIGSSKAGFENMFFDDYVNAIQTVPGMFDLIVIDGRAREACLSEAVKRLAPGGRILFDDFKRERYQAAVAQHPLAVERLDGLAACLPLPDSTALLTRTDA